MLPIGLVGALAATVALAVPVAGSVPADRQPGPRAAPAKADAAKVTKLTLRRSPYGRVLFANGYAMYVFTRDGRRRSRCYSRCAEAWPPLRLRGELVLGRGLDAELVGKTRRRNGSRQLTYAGAPLYGYVHDPRGKVLCHDVVEFGGTWYAVRGSGEPAPA